MKTFLILISLTFFQLTLFAQSSGFMISIGAATLNNAGTLTTKERAPQFSIHYRKYLENKHFHQFSLNNFWTKNFSTQSYNIKELQVGLQYAYAAKIAQLNRKTTFYIGGSGGLEYSSLDAVPQNAQVFRQRRNSFSVLTGGFAEIQVTGWEGLVFYLHFPFGVFEYGIDSVEIDDPGRPERQQRNSSFDFGLKYKFGLEFGMGWRF